MVFDATKILQAEHNAKKNGHFFGIPLSLHYVPSLCSGKIGGASGMLKQKIAFLFGIPLSLHCVPSLCSGKIGGASGMLKQKIAFFVWHSAQLALSLPSVITYNQKKYDNERNTVAL